MGRAARLRGAGRGRAACRGGRGSWCGDLHLHHRHHRAVAGPSGPRGRRRSVVSAPGPRAVLPGRVPRWARTATSRAPRGCLRPRWAPLARPTEWLGQYGGVRAWGGPRFRGPQPSREPLRRGACTGGTEFGADRERRLQRFATASVSSNDPMQPRWRGGPRSGCLSWKSAKSTLVFAHMQK